MKQFNLIQKEVLVLVQLLGTREACLKPWLFGGPWPVARPATTSQLQPGKESVCPKHKHLEHVALPPRPSCATQRPANSPSLLVVLTRTFSCLNLRWYPGHLGGNPGAALWRDREERVPPSTGCSVCQNARKSCQVSEGVRSGLRWVRPRDRGIFLKGLLAFPVEDYHLKSQ